MNHCLLPVFQTGADGSMDTTSDSGVSEGEAPLKEEEKVVPREEEEGLSQAELEEREQLQRQYEQAALQVILYSACLHNS